MPSVSAAFPASRCARRGRPTDGETDGTRLFDPLVRGLADVPPDRIAGAIVITDGRVHDVPADAGGARLLRAACTRLITGHERRARPPRRADRRAPRFGIVGQSQTIKFRVEDQGAPPGAARSHREPRRQPASTNRACPSAPASAQRRYAHGGPNILEFEAAPLDGELTEVNNRAVASIEGVRDKLRVLLVSGEPHAGERTWRNLLKSDAAVDLVHFTILRPPEKQDGTPINELSLIAFPTRELFQQKIDEFDLIIFDRYRAPGRAADPLLRQHRPLCRAKAARC